MSVHLPFPPAVLNPNSRVHWTKKAKAAKQYKEDCFWTLKAMSASYEPGDTMMGGATNYKLTFCPPDDRRRDLDNMLSSFKSGLDTIAQYAGVDDSKFRLTIEKGKPVKGGCVIVEVLNA
jgi:crossover junction endodeoxyribonuclease RusA